MPPGSGDAGIGFEPKLRLDPCEPAAHTRIGLERDEFHGEWNYRLHPREKLVAT